ncbi:M56 family metallopeptidase [Pseudohongiella sp.]|uniref:Peptidase M56 domain-containing protein n=1 Tax=marine sediment metagenome TaxID=412755 RepID=A0A0F9Z698_9ZZZZ|nr:M56 family metallopeptidase [Pseudohongiella sp.]
MINTLGTLCLIWLVLWLVLTLILRGLYPLIRSTLFRLHPAHGSVLLLLLWSAPFILSLLATSLLLVPTFGGLLLAPHCHGDCAPHVPTTSTWVLVWSGFTLAVVATLALSWHFAQSLWRGIRMRKQFDALSSRQAGYRLLAASEPAVFTLGWWRPRVYISTGLLGGCSSEELAIILAHEQAHRKRRDNLRLLLGRVFCLVLPRVWRQSVVHDLHLLCEQSCDFVAASRYGSLSVAQTLVQVGRVLRRSAAPLQGVAFDGSDLQSRVHALLRLDSRQLLSRWQIATLFAAAGLAVLLAVEPLHHGAEWMIDVLEHNMPLAHL